MSKKRIVVILVSASQQAKERHGKPDRTPAHLHPGTPTDTPGSISPAEDEAPDFTCSECSRPVGPPALDPSLRVLTLWLMQAHKGQRIAVHVNGCPMTPCICRPLFTVAMVKC